jgi:predicted DsbA family dithiol-disulfide isomerase
VVVELVALSMRLSFAVTWDYRCPFARNAHEHLLKGLEAGADWDVRFQPFSLDQTHVEEGQPPVWERPDEFRGLLVNLAGVVVRDRYPDRFFDVHWALFEARHDEGRDVRDPDVVASVLKDHGVDATTVMAEIDEGWPLQTLQREHTEVAESLGVWGVPTFIQDDRAVFVRLLDRPADDPAPSIRTVERVLELIGTFPALNEFKYTKIPF